MKMKRSPVGQNLNRKTWWKLEEEMRQQLEDLQLMMKTKMMKTAVHNQLRAKVRRP